ncbi:MAG: bifunctional folylpolyglutamate synthase/dihydrofolate synthase [Candidatus Electrothrix sp. AW5]|nr:bifunctional folylpolyglutamate synthase/dihydrofolate synthase [Candidatus Electrothrix sp. AX1]MCI5180935.1 bifunctional folylpolyglutamate synthase/dihydrofolate synthase [Candidatus Electrothrix gigas]MCI5194802.1 bifunctional folylpolyglutamate synthase/dihydrofolate synthase [Candidatus Electrothrix gigas]
MNYQEAWEFLDQLQFFKIKLGLNSMNQFLEKLGNPHRNLQYIHVGGTNGKGSVGATLCSILTAADYKVGLYTSPHLSSVRERFQIGNQYISQEDFARLISKIHDVLDGNQITYFECTTTLALLWFAEQEVDCAILEVGMGGRLDATNVVTPLISLITNVSMDHEQYLGMTLAEVATEKAGIIKPGIPVVSGVFNDDAGKVVRQTCDERKAPLFLLTREFNGTFNPNDKSLWQYHGLDGKVLVDLPMALCGNYQVANASLALAALQLLGQQGWTVTEEQIRLGLEQTFWPGRLEFFRLNDKGQQVDEQSDGLNILLDGAHNPAGVLALKHALRDFSRTRLILIWGAMNDKELRVTLREIAPLADIIIFTRLELERSAQTSQLKESLPKAMHQKVVCKETVPAALQQARMLANSHDLVCIAGSLYLVGKVRQLLLGGLVDDA